MSKTRKTYPAKFKAEVALAALREYVNELEQTASRKADAPSPEPVF